MSYDVVISQTIGGVGLRLCEAERDPAGHVDYLTVELRERFLFARTRVCMTEGHGLLQLFEWIARDWKGWTGEREWRSIEGDLTLTCSTNPMGDVLVVVTLHALSAFPPPWEVRANVKLDAGQLEGIAGAIRRFLSAD